jgi:two-component system sensor histidine kinase KdpD
MAEAMNGEFYVVYVELDSDISETRKRSLEGNVLFAENVGARVVRLQGRSVPMATADYISKNRITQVIFGRSAVKGWKAYLYYHALGTFMRHAPHVDVHIVTQVAK